MGNFLNNILGGPGIGAAQGLVGGASHQTLSEEEYVRQHLASQYTQNLAQSMMATGQQAAQNVYGQMAKGARATPVKPFNPNEDAAYNIPLSQLVTLWQANYGDQWVERFDDDFWASARVRLQDNNKLEGASGWFRIKEDA